MTGRIAVVLALLAGPALAHDGGDHADWYSSLTQPSGSSCCSSTGPSRDCGPTDDWRPTPAGYEVLWNGTWQLVPADRVITNRGNPVGRAVLCAMGTYIFCFIPGALG